MLRYSIVTLKYVALVLFTAIIINAYVIIKKSRGADRPSNCPPRAWCGCWAANQVGIHDPKQFKMLWVARNWAHYGSPARRGCVGCIAVLTRGKDGGHVGFVEGYDARGNPIIRSGNHNGAVGVGVYQQSRVIAYRAL